MSRVLLALLLALVACSPAEEASTTTTQAVTTTQPATTTTQSRGAMQLTSPEFGEGEEIPVRFTCDGENVSPELHVASLPVDTLSLALILEDPDAPVGTWYHWVEYDIAVTNTDEVTWETGVGQIGTPGLNSWNLTGYGGPCPPEGESHRYIFTVYALDGSLGLPAEATAEQLRIAMDGRILGEAVLTGTYAR